MKLHKRKRFDLIHMFHVFEVGGGAILFKTLKRLPQIITLMGWDTYSPLRKIPKHCTKYMELVLNGADIVTAPSYSLSKIAAEQGCRKKVEIIPHGSKMVENQKGSIKKDITDNSMFEGKRLILSVQRLKRVKGLEYLINAIPEIVGSNKNAYFIIAGKGDQENNLKNLVKKLNIMEYVYFPGFVNHELLPSYYSIADLFVLPSLYETFGLVYIDALSFGVPVVTTENGGSLDIIDELKGILVPPKDSKKLAEAVIKALNMTWNPEIIKKGLEKYHWENIILKYQMLYSKITDNI
jgi:glycosyltransferase involved in cell wall biosynthesis